MYFIIMIMFYLMSCNTYIPIYTSDYTEISNWEFFQHHVVSCDHSKLIKCADQFEQFIAQSDQTFDGYYFHTFETWNDILSYTNNNNPSWASIALFPS